MIAIDTNIFVATFLPPVTETDTMHRARATAVLETLRSGEQTGIVSEIVIHECFYVLVMRTGAVDVAGFCRVFRQVLDWPNWHFPANEREILLRGLDILEAHPKLEFSDAVIAARAEMYDAELATFDKRLASIHDGPAWATD